MRARPWAGHDEDGLTARERVVAAGLVASRKTSRGVAAELCPDSLANIFPKRVSAPGTMLSAGLSVPQPSVLHR
jgi:hypothetical protein